MQKPPMPTARGVFAAIILPSPDRPDGMIQMILIYRKPLMGITIVQLLPHIIDHPL